MISRFRAVALVTLPVVIASTFATSPALAGKKKTAYVVTNLVSNGAVDAPNFDPNMVNTWGVAFNPTGLVWVTNNRTGTSTLYDGQGVPNSLIVNVPPASGGGTGLPTGIVFSGTDDFIVANGTASGASRFLFASEDGLVSGWAPGVDLHNAMRAVVTPGANYKGLAIAQSATGMRLYATDFHQGHVDMFDGAFNKVSVAGAFVDPKLPKDTYPFAIQAIAGNLYVTFAKHGGGLTGGHGGTGDARTADKGGGDSVVDVFDTDGKLLRRAVASSALKQPWGLALAPADFGKYAGDLLVGDFHDGTISAFDPATGKLKGQLSDARGKAIVIPGLWGFQFGNGVNSQPTNALFFAAGPHGQGGGVYGSVTVAGK
jgi:uncharacterized protein (TIGR03118 family)